VHLVGFTIEMYYDARPNERQIKDTTLLVYNNLQWLKSYVLHYNAVCYKPRKSIIRIFYLQCVCIHLAPIGCCFSWIVQVCGNACSRRFKLYFGPWDQLLQTNKGVSFLWRNHRTVDTSCVKEGALISKEHIGTWYIKRRRVKQSRYTPGVVQRVPAS
jgi:hypothetical protein